MDIMKMDEVSPLLENEVIDGENQVEGSIIKTYMNEAKSLTKIALPMMMTNLMVFLILSESVIICGQLGKYEMDGASLANSIVNVGGIAIAVGFCTACDTFFSQICGSKHKKYLGMMLQRSILISLSVPFVLIGLHINWEPLLILLGQETEVAIKAARFLTLFSPGFVFVFESLILTRYLQNQYYVAVPMISAIIASAFNIGSQYLFVIVLQYGYEASAICQAFTYFLNWLIQLSFILISKLYETNWTGWTMDCLMDWGLFFNLAFAGICLLFFEVASWEIGTFLSGVLGVVPLGAQSVLFHYETALFQACFAIGVAVNIRVGEALGASNWKRGIITYRCGLIISLIYGLISAILFISLKDYLVLLFSNNKEITDLASEAFPIMIGALLMDYVGTITMSALRGCGRQKCGILLVLLGFYLLGQPIGISLAFATPLGIKGIWIGLIISLFISSSIGFTFTNFIMDWQHQSKMAQERIRDNVLEDDENEDNLEIVSEKPIYHHSRGLSTSLIPNQNRKGPITTKVIAVTDENYKKIIKRRILIYVVVFLILLCGILIKNILPRSMYLTLNSTALNG